MKKTIQILKWLLINILLISLTACGGGNKSNITEEQMLIDKIIEFQNNELIPTLNDYDHAGIKNVTENNINILNKIIRNKPAEEVDTIEEIQNIVNILIHSNDTIKPIIILKGEPTVTLTVGETYNDAGATASDNKDGDISNNIQIQSNVDTSKAGTYTLTYSVSDAAGNIADVVSRSVSVNEAPDTIKPIIILKGEPTVTLTVGETYNDAGATASDNKDGDISNNIQIQSNVDTSKAGTYTLTYSVSDAAGNIADVVSRSVSVNEAPDTIKPIIILKGEPTVTLTVGETYNDAGATASDNKDGDISNNIQIQSNVDTSKAGTYTLTYSVSDAAGNIADVVSRSVSVNEAPDTIKPIIILKGEPTVTLTVGETYNDAGATASDNKDGDISNNIQIQSNVDTSKAGTYTLTYSVSDAAGNIADVVSRSVSVNEAPDTIKPIIILKGEPTVTLTVGETYNDAGATASDNKDGDISNNIQIQSNVDTSKAGTYTLTYSVSDAAGNIADVVSRSVSVNEAPDTIKPIIILKGEPTVTLTVGETYNDAGATASDNKDGDISNNIQIQSNVDTSKAGTYTLTYSVSDAAGNIADVVSRSVSVNEAPDTIKPIIILKGEPTVTLTVGETYNDAGATASDNKDGDISNNIQIQSNVDTSKAGTYTLTYSVSDAAGNIADVVSRSVSVNEAPDTIKPIIILKGEPTVTLTVGETYNDAGATASDNKDGDISNNIQIQSNVDTSKAGTYTLTYSVSDAAGNIADVVSRSVNIILENSKPVKRTGQTISYADFDDGYYQKGIAVHYTRDNDKEIVTDVITGLMWQDNYAVKDDANKKPWITQANYDTQDYNNTSGDTAMTYCNELIMGTYDDWRLPTIKELESIVATSQYNIDTYTPAIDPIFQYTKFNTYWSGTKHVKKSQYAWWVYFARGDIDEALKNISFHIRCVRTIDKN